jgi:hypothetical protein
MNRPSICFEHENFPLFFKYRPDKPDSTSPVRETREDPEQEEEMAQAVRCRVCGHVITHKAEQISINGAHQHVFANPHGLVFETVCYKRAMGCVVTGPPSDEFTWFSGYLWQIALCGGCLNHLGWRFTSSTNTFFCLISNQLILF